ncbi:MAG: carbohydrate porin [Alphaproteobacteria bacterium]|nr:carbohydrate porin [Alphaproteobacteria bacterium]
MLKLIITTMLFIISILEAKATNYWKNYEIIKQNISNKYNIDYGLDITYSLQNINNQTISREFVIPYLKKELYNNNLGKGKLNFSMNIVKFNHQLPIDVAKKEKMATLFNSYDTNYNELYELYYEHLFGQKYNYLSFGLGQIPISKFDSPIKSDLQTQYFLNSSLAQNTTFSYPTSGIGGYVSSNLNEYTSLILGAIDATNPLANGIHIKNLDKYKLSKFIAINYFHKLFGKYQSSYSLLLYDKPSVEKSPINSKGWSLYLAQDISDRYSMFFRINGSSGDYSLINKSYSLGFLFDNPFNRKNNDKLGFAYSINKPKEALFDNKIYHKYEHIIETYYDYKIDSHISIRPDIQLYINPSLEKNKNSKAIFSLSLSFNI